MRLYELSLVSKKWLNSPTEGFLEPTVENISKAKEFVFRKWKERAIERMEREPLDLSTACKFSSLFVKMVFGGTIKGTWEHQYNDINGVVVDLNSDAGDVLRLLEPHKHDRRFIGNREHNESLESCIPRVKRWVEEFHNSVS
jgi:hypothetical protein